MDSSRTGRNVYIIERGGSLQLFDLHCDSIVNYKKEQSDFLCGKTQFSLKELVKFRRLCQTMAVFIPSGATTFPSSIRISLIFVSSLYFILMSRTYLPHNWGLCSKAVNREQHRVLYKM